MGVEYDQETGKNTIFKAGPISNEITGVIRSRSRNTPPYTVIVDIILSLKQCTHLFDGRRKEEAFQRFSQNVSNTYAGEYRPIKITFEINGNHCNFCSTTCVLEKYFGNDFVFQSLFF